MAQAISAHVNEHAGAYDHIVATADWHIDPGDHFAEDPDYVDTWPVHCVAGSAGSAFHPNLAGALDSIQAVFRKGEYSAAYSGFECHGIDADASTLADWLAERWRLPRRRRRDRHGPLRAGHRARCPARGLDTTVLLDLTAGVARNTTEAALAQPEDAGVRLEGAPVVQR